MSSRMRWENPIPVDINDSGTEWQRWGWIQWLLRAEPSFLYPYCLIMSAAPAQRPLHAFTEALVLTRATRSPVHICRGRAHLLCPHKGPESPSDGTPWANSWPWANHRSIPNSALCLYYRLVHFTSLTERLFCQKLFYGGNTVLNKAYTITVHPGFPHSAPYVIIRHVD